MRKLLVIGLCLLQGCITTALWSGYNAEETVALTTTGEARLVQATVDPVGPRIFADVELIDDQDAMRVAFEGLRTTLKLTPITPTLPGSLLRLGRVAGCRLDEVRPYLQIRVGSSGETEWNMRVDWCGVCARIPDAEAPAAYRSLALLREDALDSRQRGVVDQLWASLAQSGLRGISTATREAVGWLDAEGKLADTTKEKPFAPSPRLPAFVVVRIRAREGAVSYLEIPTVLLSDPSNSKLSGGTVALAWSHSDAWSVEPRALAPPGLARLAANQRSSTFGYEHILITTRRNEGGLVWRILLTPVTIVADIPFVLFWLWLDDKLDDNQ